MKISIAFLLTLAVPTSQAQCQQNLLLPENSVSACLLQNMEVCSNTACDEGDGFAGGVKMTCDEVEEEFCPGIRCCEACWETKQNLYQCTVVEPNGSVLGGWIEQGCVLDCTRFPVGATKSPTPASVNNGTPPSPNVAPPPTNTIMPVGAAPPADSMPVANNNCDEDAEMQKFDDCIAEKGCSTCYPGISQIELDTSNIDVCSYFEPALCLVDTCCKECSDQFRNALACNSGTTLFGCNNLSCSNIIAGDDSGASSTFMAFTIGITLGLVVANAVNN